MIVGPSLLNQLVVSHELITPNYSGPITKDSIDLRIESIFKHSGKAILTLEERDIGKFEEIEMVECIWTLSPNTTYIGMTAEEVALPPFLAAIAMGRSTMFRAGCPVSTGYIDPGYHGHIYFEFSTPSPHNTIISFGFPVIQLVFMMAEPTQYNGAYQGGQFFPSQP